jgi:hypothetical protein
MESDPPETHVANPFRTCFASDGPGATGRVWLCVGPVFFCLLDAFMTLNGQPAAYWNGDYGQVNELNPIARVMLTLHPLAFVILVCVALMVACTLIILLRESLARPLAFVPHFGHTIGAASWMAIEWGGTGWVVGVLLLCFSRLLLEWTWKLEARADGRVSSC